MTDNVATGRGKSMMEVAAEVLKAARVKLASTPAKSLTAAAIIIHHPRHQPVYPLGIGKETESPSDGDKLTRYLCGVRITGIILALVGIMTPPTPSKFEVHYGGNALRLISQQPWHWAMLCGGCPLFFLRVDSNRIPSDVGNLEQIRDSVTV